MASPGRAIAYVDMISRPRAFAPTGREVGIEGRVTVANVFNAPAKMRELGAGPSAIGKLLGDYLLK